MYGFSTCASGTVPQNYAQQSRPFQNSPIAHRLHNQESDRRPREPRFAYCVLRIDLVFSEVFLSSTSSRSMNVKGNFKFFYKIIILLNWPSLFRHWRWLDIGQFLFCVEDVTNIHQTSCHNKVGQLQRIYSVKSKKRTFFLLRNKKPQPRLGNPKRARYSHRDRW